MFLIYSVGNLKGYSINYYLFKYFRKIWALMKKIIKNIKNKKFMKSIYKKIIFIISAIALFSVIVGIVKYSLTNIENNPEKYLPTQK